MEVLKIAAFSDGEAGGNPAGVVIRETLPSATVMQQGEGWRVRYFSPESEVPFCGHATIALGAALAGSRGDGVFPLVLNDAEITVEGRTEGKLMAAALQSPPTRSGPAHSALVSEALVLFGYTAADLSPAIPPALIHGGADHLLLALGSRAALAAMAYDLDQGKIFMRRSGLVTVMLVHAETQTLFHSRNPFASGGVYEDPATGASWRRDRGDPGRGYGRAFPPACRNSPRAGQFHPCFRNGTHDGLKPAAPPAGV